MTMSSRLLYMALACVLTSSDALHVHVARPHGIARALPRVRPVVAAETEEAAAETAETDFKPGELTEAQKLEIEQNELSDPLMQAAGGNSDFVRWYRFEQAKEEYLKENPTDVLANAVEKLKGPLSSLVIIVAGFYAIPIVRGLADGFREGDVIGSLTQQLANPGESVKF